MTKVLKIETIFLSKHFNLLVHSFPLEEDKSHQNEFPLLFIWNLFCGAKYPELPGKIPPKFNNKYVT
jgi:hypothetical protein